MCGGIQMAGSWRIEQLDSLEFSNRMQEQGGFNMVEVIVAMLLVAMVISGFVPLYSYIHENLIMNTTKAVAYNLAESQIEAIKASNFSSTHMSGMGTYVTSTVDGDPPGQFPQEIDNLKYSTTPTVVYTVLTQIWWEPDYSRSSNPNDKNNGTQIDYKDISVEVKAKNVNNANMLYADISLNTRATKESGELPGGTNIIVSAISGWTGALEGDVMIDLTGPSPSLTTYQELSDPKMSGQVLFPSLATGGYTIVASDNNGLMVAPSYISQSCTLATGQTLPVTVPLESPCHLTLNFYDAQTLQPINLTTSVGAVLWPSATGLSSTAFGATGQSYPLSVNLWPTGTGCDYDNGPYDLQLHGIEATQGLYNMYQFSLTNPPYVDWPAGPVDGEFDNPGETLNINMHLIPSPGVDLVDQNGDPITTTVATVEVYDDTYENGVVTQSMATYTSPSANNGDGLYYFRSLPSNVAYVNSTTTYTCYRVYASASGYNPATYNAAFWITSCGWDSGWQKAMSGGFQQPATEIPFLATLTAN
jgi:type II secretory pathway pseudopilin PulG